MSKLTSAMIKEAAFAAGADLCGIGSMDRFEGAPKDMDPRYLFPEAKSVIGFAFRIPRGVQRGIEEGTQFYQSPSMAYGGINEIYAPAVLYQVGRVIEDAGYEAMVYRNTGARGSVSDMDGSPGNSLSPEEQINVSKQAETKAAHHRSVQFTRPVREESVAPDLQFHFRLAAVVCGLAGARCCSRRNSARCSAWRSCSPTRSLSTMRCTAASRFAAAAWPVCASARASAFRISRAARRFP